MKSGNSKCIKFYCTTEHNVYTVHCTCTDVTTYLGCMQICMEKENSVSDKRIRSHGYIHRLGKQFSFCIIEETSCCGIHLSYTVHCTVGVHCSCIIHIPETITDEEQYVHKRGREKKYLFAAPNSVSIKSILLSFITQNL